MVDCYLIKKQGRPDPALSGIWKTLLETFKPTFKICYSRQETTPSRLKTLAVPSTAVMVKLTSCMILHVALHAVNLKISLV
jgi:hypothetical protein